MSKFISKGSEIKKKNFMLAVGLFDGKHLRIFSINMKTRHCQAELIKTISLIMKKAPDKLRFNAVVFSQILTPHSDCVFSESIEAGEGLEL